MKKKLKNLEQFEEAIKTIRDDILAQGEDVKVYMPTSPLYDVVDSAFGYWKTGWFLIMVKYNLDIENYPQKSYKVKIGEIE